VIGSVTYTRGHRSLRMRTKIISRFHRKKQTIEQTNDEQANDE